MIPAQVKVLKSYQREDAEGDEGDNLLSHLQLNERERAAVALKSYTVGGDLESVLQQRHAP